MTMNRSIRYRSTYRLLGGFLLTVLISISAGWADDSSANLSDLLSYVRTYRYGQDREPLSKIQDLVRTVSGTPEEKAHLADSLAGLLDSGTTYDGMLFLCRQLARIGDGAQVPRLAGLLKDATTAHLARIALEMIPGAEARGALIDSLRSEQVSIRIGSIGSLGMRGEEESVSALSRFLESSERDEVFAAVAALGKIGGSLAVRTLAAARDRVEPSAELEGLYIRITDAYLACADRYLREGEGLKANAIYELLYSEDEPPVVRMAALRGQIRAREYERARLVLKALRSREPLVQQTALEAIRNLPGREDTLTYALGVRDFPEDLQVEMLRALADRGESGGTVGALLVMTQASPRVRIEALRTLGKLGDAGSVLLLTRSAAQLTGDEQRAALDALAELRGEGVDEQITDRMRIARAPAKAALIEVLNRRKAMGAVSALLEVVREESDREARIAAWKALAGLARSGAMEELIRISLAVRDPEEREAAGEAVNAVGLRTGDTDQTATKLMDILTRIDDVPTRSSLLVLLGKTGASAALPELRSGLNSEEEEIRTVCRRAILDWPNAEVLEDVRAMAREMRTGTPDTETLGSLLRLIGLSNDRPDDEIMAFYREAYGYCTDASQKRMVLESLGGLAIPEALEMATGALKDPDLATVAGTSAIRIARALSAADPERVKAALDLVQEVSSTETILHQVKAVREMMAGFQDFILAWEVSGPYLESDRTGPQLFDTPFAPETEETAIWRIFPAGLEPGNVYLIDLTAYLGGENRVAYLRASVHSPVEQSVRLELGSDDGVKAWLNDEVVHANNATRGVNPGQDKVAITLQEGWNSLMLKITQGNGGWAAVARIAGPEGETLEGLEVRARRQ